MSASCVGELAGIMPPALYLFMPLISLFPAPFASSVVVCARLH